MFNNIIIFKYNYFIQTYASRCLYSFIIDGSVWGPFYIDKKIHDKYVKKTLNITNEDIQDLIKKIKTTQTTKTTNDNNQYTILKLNDIISGYLEKQMPTTAKYLKVKTYSLRNLQINADPGGGKDTDKIIQTKIQAEDYFTKHNPKIYNTKYLVNKTHMVFWNKEGRYNILEIIKCCIANE